MQPSGRPGVAEARGEHLQQEVSMQEWTESSTGWECRGVSSRGSWAWTVPRG